MSTAFSQSEICVEHVDFFGPCGATVFFFFLESGGRFWCVPVLVSSLSIARRLQQLCWLHRLLVDPSAIIAARPVSGTPVDHTLDGLLGKFAECFPLPRKVQRWEKRVPMSCQGEPLS